MTPAPACPRCGDDVQEPGPQSTSWRCVTHGVVSPLYQLSVVTSDAVGALGVGSEVPLWFPSPCPPGWTVSGLAWAGPDGTPTRATALACSGPAPLGGRAELVLVAEEPGTGLGSGYAALPGPDPGAMPAGPPHALVRAAGHATPLWVLPTRDDRCVYVGEALGVWLWAVLWPAEAGLLFVEDLVLHDLREHVPGDLVPGEPTPYLRPGR